MRGSSESQVHWGGLYSAPRCYGTCRACSVSSPRDMQTTTTADEEASESRRQWLADAHTRYGAARREPLHLSTHGLMLQVDLDRAFVGGAWASVIVLSQAIIEATMRQIQLHDYETKAKTLFKGVGRLERIRDLRNELIHPGAPGSPSIVWQVPNGDVLACQAQLELDARRAVEYMLYVVYSEGRRSPGAREFPATAP